MDVILELGGNPNRVNKTIEVAKLHPETLIIISSEIYPDILINSLNSAGIANNRILLDYQAWDTVTNFTTTYNLIKSFNPQKLYVVTEAFHMRRAMAIAGVIYFKRGIELISSPYETTHSPEPIKLTIMDFLRASLWRLTGRLLYDPAVKNERMPGIKADEQYAISKGYPVNL